MERSLILLKPDCIQKRLVGTVLERFQKAGFKIIGCKMMAFSKKLLKEHYAHITREDFFPKLEKFMLSGPVMAIVLEGRNVVRRARRIVGATDPKRAAKGSIRNDFGRTSMDNICHASDTTENAQIEIKRFFKPSEVYALRRK